MVMKFEKVRGLAHWAPYLVNGDASGMSELDLDDCHRWCRDTREELSMPPGTMVVVCGVSGVYVARFGWDHADCVDYTVRVRYLRLLAAGWLPVSE